MTPCDIDAAARTDGLALRGTFHPAPGDGAPDRCGTLLLLGPDEPRFWPIFSASSEFLDGARAPLDRWSKRVIGSLAERFDGTAVFPSDGPPYPSFFGWALASGDAFSAPPGLLVHARAGLLISYRGAICLPQRLDLPPRPASPCIACAQPCRSACPVGALGSGAPYEVDACQRHLRRPEGADCRTRGCLVRRACPASANMQRQPSQAAFHMASFMEHWRPETGDTS
ncbi:ferredoxin [Alloyangia pacifica]|uniref:ferredoxin n=1 Tax=Alloyangia pacifica TaxID=311180 RepID=UPI001CFD1197|nr:ferredoxin [Alloyangia pacifica]